MILLENYYFKVNILLEKDGAEKGKNIIITGNSYLMVIIQMAKCGKDLEKYMKMMN